MVSGDEEYQGYDQLIGLARVTADEIDEKFRAGWEPTGEATLLRRLADNLEARRDRHFWRARAISYQRQCDFMSVNFGKLEDRLRGIRGKLQAIEYYEGKPHKASADVINLLRFLDGDERDDDE